MQCKTAGRRSTISILTALSAIISRNIHRHKVQHIVVLHLVHTGEETLCYLVIWGAKLQYRRFGLA